MFCEVLKILEKRSYQVILKELIAPEYQGMQRQTWSRAEQGTGMEDPEADILCLSFINCLGSTW